VLKGDLCQSIITNTSVMGEFLDCFLATFELTVCAMIFTLMNGLPAGVAASRLRSSPAVI
jgi:dipeptide transport system permease protein